MLIVDTDNLEKADSNTTRKRNQSEDEEEEGEGEGDGEEGDGDEEKDGDQVTEDKISDESSKLPVDTILRPIVNYHVSGTNKQPEGWKVRVPPKVFQFFSNKGYRVTATHVPGNDFITLNWIIKPPTWEEFLAISNHFYKKEDVIFDNDEVKQQVLSFNLIYLFPHSEMKSHIFWKSVV